MALGRAMGTLAYRVNPTSQEEKLDICPGCVADLLAWLAAGDLIMREVKAYKDPWTPPMDSTTAARDVKIDSLLAMSSKLLDTATKAISGSADTTVVGRDYADNYADEDD